MNNKKLFTKKYTLVVDVETANSLEDALPYDIGFCVIDRQGVIYEEYSYVVSEIFLGFRELMETAYYAEKLPNYWEDIKNKKREVASVWVIRRLVHELIKKYDIAEVAAYNMNFDLTALNNLVRFISGSACRWFFPYGIEFQCIWHMATQTLCNTKGYITKAMSMGWQSEKGNIQTSAEVVYRFLTNNTDFEEEHTGLEDVKIEVEILQACRRKKKKMNKGINRQCWQIPQAKTKEYKEKMAEV